MAAVGCLLGSPPGASGVSSPLLTAPSVVLSGCGYQQSCSMLPAAQHVLAAPCSAAHQHALPCATLLPCLLCTCPAADADADTPTAHPAAAGACQAELAGRAAAPDALDMLPEAAVAAANGAAAAAGAGGRQHPGQGFAAAQGPDAAPPAPDGDGMLVDDEAAAAAAAAAPVGAGGGWEPPEDAFLDAEAEASAAAAAAATESGSSLAASSASEGEVSGESEGLVDPSWPASSEEQTSAVSMSRSCDPARHHKGGLAVSDPYHGSTLLAVWGAT